MNLSIGGDLAPSLGDGKNFADQEGFFKKKNSIFTAKISDDLFLVIDHDLRIFPIFHIFAACNVVFDPFFTRKTPISENIPSRHLFYSVRAFAHIRQTLLLKILGGWMHGPSPPSQILGGPFPQSITLITLKMCVSLVYVVEL